MAERRGATRMLKSLLVRHRFTCPGEAGSPPENQLHYCAFCAQLALLAELGISEATVDKAVASKRRLCETSVSGSESPVME